MTQSGVIQSVARLGGLGHALMYDSELRRKMAVGSALTASSSIVGEILVTRNGKRCRLSASSRSDRVITSNPSSATGSGVMRRRRPFPSATVTVPSTVL